MSAQITPLRITAEDIPSKKVGEAIGPLLEDLNVTIQDIVTAFARLPDEELVTISLVTGAAVADSFPIRFRTAVPQPRGVVLANIVPKDPAHSLLLPFVVNGFGITDEGLVSVKWITGLLPSNGYQFTFAVR